MVTVVSVYGVRVPNTTRTDQTRRLAVADNGRAYTVVLGACPVNRSALVAAAARQRPINTYQTNPPIRVLTLADAIAAISSFGRTAYSHPPGGQWFPWPGTQNLTPA